MQPAPPCPGPTHWWQIQVSGQLLRWQLWLGTYSVGFFFFPPSFVALLKFQNPPQTCLWEGFQLCGNFLTTPSPGWVSIPKSFVFVFLFYILSYRLSKRMGCLYGCMVSSASIHKLFCGSCSTFKWSFWWRCGRESGLPILFLCHLQIN